MRPKKPKTTEEGDLFRARLDQIINVKHELVQTGLQDRLGLDRKLLVLQGAAHHRDGQHPDLCSAKPGFARR